MSPFDEDPSENRSELELCIDEIHQLQAENERLKEFARVVIRQECWCLYELDGCEIQDLAEKLDLIVSRIATEEDVDDESDFEVGDTFYKFTDMLEEDKP